MRGGDSAIVLTSSALVLLLGVVLLLSLPADGLYAGDPGLKLIAAFNAIDHPGRPLEIDLPRLGNQPVKFVERFFALHGDHTHALQSPLFPLTAAPLIALAGLRGAYVLPLASFVALLPLLALIRRRLRIETPLWLLMSVAAVASPVFFYALEFWEHVPAIALLAGATALSIERPTQSGSETGRMVAAGVLGGLAIALRPEAAWYVVPLIVIAGRALTRFVAICVGVIIPLGAFAAVNFAHAGNPLGPHAAANLAPLEHGWGALRLHLLQTWLWPSTLPGVCGLLVIGLAHALRVAGVQTAHRQVTALAGVALMTLASANGLFARETIWNAWPLIAILLVPGLNLPRPLWALALVPMAMVLLTAPHDGGAQWGPRFLLIASPALIPLAAAAAHQLHAADKQWRRTRTVLIYLVLLGSVFVSRNAFRELRGAKEHYARLVKAVETSIPPAGYVVTNVWWFDQITAPLYRRHTVLFAESEAGYRAAIDSIAGAGIRDVTLVSSREDQSDSQTSEWIRNTCIRVVSATGIPERLVEFKTARCE